MKNARKMDTGTKSESEFINNGLQKINVICLLRVQHRITSSIYNRLIVHFVHWVCVCAHEPGYDQVNAFKKQYDKTSDGLFVIE